MGIQDFSTLHVAALGFWLLVSSLKTHTRQYMTQKLYLEFSFFSYINSEEDTVRRHFVSCWDSQIHLSSGRKIYRNHLG